MNLLDKIISALEHWKPRPEPAPVKPAPVPPTPSPVPVPPSPAPTPDDVATRLLEAHNAFRASQGKPPLVPDTLLARAAQVHANLMAASRRMSHQLPGEPTPWERITDTGYRYTRAAENVAAGQRDVAEVMGAWEHSPGHLANILGPCTQMGAGMALGGDGTPYWSVSFATPMNRYGAETPVRMEFTSQPIATDKTISWMRHAPEGERWEGDR